MAFNEITKGFNLTSGEAAENKKNKRKNEYISGYAPEIIEQARQAAREMAENGENLRTIPIGWESGHLWLSNDKDLVVGTENILVDGKIYYIGLAKKE